MFQPKISESARAALYSRTILCIVAITTIFTANFFPAVASTERRAIVNSTTALSPDATFPGVGVGPIPDGGSGCDPSPGPSLDIIFGVSGIASAPNSVSVSITLAHPYLGDI